MNLKDLLIQLKILEFFIKAINFPFSGLARYNKTFSSKYEEKNENQI